MTLLFTVFAAIFATILWYSKPDSSMKIGMLSLIYWGAALMWLVDAIAEYNTLGTAFFTPTTSDMLNDGYLGLSVIALGLIIWLVTLFIKDPTGRMKAILSKNNTT